MTPDIRQVRESAYSVLFVIRLAARLQRVFVRSSSSCVVRTALAVSSRNCPCSAEYRTYVHFITSPSTCCVHACCRTSVVGPVVTTRFASNLPLISILLGLYNCTRAVQRAVLYASENSSVGPSAWYSVWTRKKNYQFTISAYSCPQAYCYPLHDTREPARVTCMLPQQHWSDSRTLYRAVDAVSAAADVNCICSS